MSIETKTNLHLEIAHILFIDVVDYSKLLINEQTELVQKLNDIVLHTEQVQTADESKQLLRLATGDGMALVFRNHPEAPAACALEIAAALKNHPEIQVRMGVHSGPVNEVTDVNQRANITGAGVNMAQRVMDCGDAGHILVSKRVADDLSQYRNWRPLLHDLGEVEVKHEMKILLANLYTDDLGNPASPKKIAGAKRASRGRRTNLAAIGFLVVLGIGAGIWWLANRAKSPSSPSVVSTSAAPISAKSIAVLPLENLSDNKENAFFADGIQDDVLTSLAKIKDLKVISRTSVMSYRDKTTRNLKQIGKELGVANVLEGSVRRVANRVLVNVQLIDTATDQHIWAERYDRTLADSITLQGELASEIANALRATLSPEEKTRLETKPTDNPDAYVAYLRGREVQLRPETSRENYLTAVSFYKQAIALDPRFVLARARLSYMQGWLYAFFDPTNAALLAEARRNAEEALRLDASSAEAHLALARCAFLVEDKDTVKRELAAAIRLLPNDASVAMAAAITQSQLGWEEESAANYKRAAELAPREPKIFYNYYILLLQMGEEAEARAAVDHALVLAPDSVLFRLTRARSEITWSGDLRRAREIMAGLPAGKDPDGRVTAAYCHLALFERNFAEALKLLQAYPGESLPDVASGSAGLRGLKAYSEGVIRLYAGDRDRAYECFEEARWTFEVAVKEKPLSPIDHVCLAQLYAQMGWKEPAKAEAARVLELEASAGADPKRRLTLGLASVYAWAGELDLAWSQIEQYLALPISKKLTLIHDFRLDPAWDPLRKDPRFQELLNRKKL